MEIDLTCLVVLADLKTTQMIGKIIIWLETNI